MKKNMYKIFGAAAIIGLFLISSIASTSLAAIIEDTKSYEAVTESGELQSVSEEEPELGLIFPDLKPIAARKQAGKIVVTVKNLGLGLVNPLKTYTIHVTVHKLFDEHVYIERCRGPVLPGRTKEFSTGSISGLYSRVTVDVDCYNDIFEGFLGGERNNEETYTGL